MSSHRRARKDSLVLIAVVSALVISSPSISNFGYFDITKVVYGQSDPDQTNSNTTNLVNTEDMNETGGYVRIDNETGSKIYPPRPFFQIAEYLTERGFAVLQYNKRGIGENVTILDSNVWGNLTFNNQKQDAEKALDVLIQQPEVDANRITVLGHSEGTIITPRIAIDNPGKVKNIVLYGNNSTELT